jgi:CheY-like chemotaxis protein/HPt (histidine-containing phosphotransfer) domain-containing protein
MIAGTAASGPAALEMLHAARAGDAPYDVVLLDMDMPGMDGLDVARAIRSQAALSSLRLLLLTSSGVRGTADEARAAGIAAYLTKPVRQSQLFDAIAAVMADATDREPLVTEETIAESRARSRPRVLVAEDNAVNQKVAVAMLARIGFEADVVANGAEAVEAVARRAYGAVLMDCQMPEMDGYAATGAIRAREAGGVRLPIIAMTAGAMEGDRERCLAAGMDDYLAKPVALDALDSALRRWVGAAAPADGPQAAGTAAGDPEEAPDDVIDPTTLATLRSLTADEEGGFASLAQVFVDSAGERVASLRAAQEAADAATMRRDAHTLKGGAASFGALDLATACADLETTLASSDGASIAPAVERIAAEFGRVEAWLAQEGRAG